LKPSQTRSIAVFVIAGLSSSNVQAADTTVRSISAPEDASLVLSNLPSH
jgi:hypothetical protein